jgi:hypothetical protein
VYYIFMDQNELINTLKSQHRTLQNSLKSITVVLEHDLNSPQKANLILTELNKFKQELDAHLKLENETFYKDYFAKKQALGGDVDKDQEFMNQMNEIGKKVMEFLNKYDQSAKIESSLISFGLDLKAISAVLNTRIETEEEGIYSLYLLF